MKKPEKPILVTQPRLPDLREFVKSLELIWESKWLTNNGKFHQKFEEKLKQHLVVNYISVFSNGTLALITALQALRITGEVITTPFSFVATTHALHWNRIKPVFCDIDPVYGNIDPDKLESLITPSTTAILAVHVYGNPAQHRKLQKIADTYGLKLIYDAAHAFGVEENGTSILNYGDLSILSFHATKTFNTIEGGAIICHDEKTKKRIDHLKNFGFADEVTVVAPGINAKMNELQAAYGLLQFSAIEVDRLKRKEITEFYREKLRPIKGITCLMDMGDVKHNYSYFPVLVENEYTLSRDALYEKLKENNIFGRRYFYPLISNMPTYKDLPSANKGQLNTANLFADKVLCLPLYSDLSKADVEIIVDVIAKC